MKNPAFSITGELPEELSAGVEHFLRKNSVSHLVHRALS